MLVLERYRLACRQGVKNIGIEVRSVWPDDRAELGVNTDPCEFGRILEWRKYTSEIYKRGKVYIGLDAVFETKAEHVGGEGADFDDIFEHDLLQWRDFVQWLLLTRKVPVFEKLVPVQCGPFGDETECAWGRVDPREDLEGLW